MRELALAKVEGKPIPQGALVPGAAGRMYWQNGVTLKPYRRAIAAAITAALPDGFEPIDAAVGVLVAFTFGTKDEKKWWTPKATMPDTDKLVRAVGDALTGVVYTDDSRVTQWHAAKMWADEDSTVIKVYAL